MGWTAEAFRENMNLEHSESARIFQFILKAVAAIAYIYVLGFFAAGGEMSAMIWTVLLVGALFDLIPELLTMHSIHVLPDTAKRAEITQIGIAAFAYILLVITLFSSNGMPVFTGYAAFTLLWIMSFLVQESVLLYLGETGGI